MKDNVIYYSWLKPIMGFLVDSVVKNLPAKAGVTVGVDSVPGLGRSSGGENGHPLQYSCLEQSHGQRSLAGYSPWGCKESDMTEATWHACTPTYSFGLCLWSRTASCIGINSIPVGLCTSTSIPLSFILNTQPGFYHMTSPPFSITDHETVL